MSTAAPRRPRTEIIIAIAATIVSICAMVTTVYQTYILRQQQHAAVWPRLLLANGYWVTKDTAFYQLFIQNNGIGPAIIREVSIAYEDSLYVTTADLAQDIARQNGLSDSIAYQNYRDLLPDMVVPQQEMWELLQIHQRAYVIPFVKQVEDKDIKITVKYESLYGEKWEVGYPELLHRKIE